MLPIPLELMQVLPLQCPHNQPAVDTLKLMPV
jgi:hypothetical protein